MKKSELRQIVKEVLSELDEANTSGAVGGYMTPFAFSKGNKKNRATKGAERVGMKKVETKKRPYHTKGFDYL